MSCRNGKDSLGDGQEVSKKILKNEILLLLNFHPQVTIETPNYPENYPDKAKCNWRIRVPANEEVHIWCETFDLLKGDYLRVSIKNFAFTIIILLLKVRKVTDKIVGTFEDGFGEIIPATSKSRWLRFDFRSNKKKNAGGFRCQVFSSGSWFSFFNDFLRLLLLPPLLLGRGLER